MATETIEPSETSLEQPKKLVPFPDGSATSSWSSSPSPPVSAAPTRTRVPAGPWDRKDRRAAHERHGQFAQQEQGLHRVLRLGSFIPVTPQSNH
jgi:hypothetical protein